MINKINKAKQSAATKLAMIMIGIVIAELKKIKGVTNIVSTAIPKYIAAVDACDWKIKFDYNGMKSFIDQDLQVELVYKQKAPQMTINKTGWVQGSLVKLLGILTKQIKQTRTELETEELEESTPEDKIFDLNLKTNKKIAKLATQARAAIKWFNENSYEEFQELIDGESTTDILELVNSFGRPESKHEFTVAEKFAKHYYNLFDYLLATKQITKTEHTNYLSAELYPEGSIF
jgi:hypothetical protein